MTTQDEIVKDIREAAQFHTRESGLTEDEADVMWLLVAKMTGNIGEYTGAETRYVNTQVMASRRWVASALRWTTADKETGEILPDADRARNCLRRLVDKGVLVRVPFDQITFKRLRQAIDRKGRQYGRRAVVYELVRRHRITEFDPLDFIPDEGEEGLP